MHQVQFKKYQDLSRGKNINTAEGVVEVLPYGFAQITDEQFDEFSHSRYSFLKMIKVDDVPSDSDDNLEDDKNDDRIEESTKEDIKQKPAQPQKDPGELLKEVEQEEQDVLVKTEDDQDQEEINQQEDTDDLDDQIKQEFFNKLKSGQYIKKEDLQEIADLYEFPSEQWKGLNRTKLIEYLKDKLS